MEGAINGFGKRSLFLGDLIGCKLFLEFEGNFSRSPNEDAVRCFLERLKIGFSLGVSRGWGVLVVGVDGG